VSYTERKEKGDTTYYYRARSVRKNGKVTKKRVYLGRDLSKKQLKEAEIKPTWQMYRVLTGQEKKKHFGLIRLDPDRPSPTILGDTGCTTAGLIHPYAIRKLTINEIKALASYPEEFRLEGSYRAKWARIGNSVPPLFMKALAEHLRCNFLMPKSPIQ